ncbi:MAG: sigma-70 family RNA polymerase sigma factor [Acidimicrobiales bacterium]|nr:sigma-70 family RNA polymerase sigma factor [Acidimicrobiales bacterium]
MEKFSSSPNLTDSGFSTLFEAERLAMLRMATLMVGSGAVAEEVVQDAFAAVSERWDRLERPGGYLRTAVVNGCAQVLRRRATESRAKQQVPVETTTELPTRLLELRDALDRLNERQRIVIVLRYFVDISDEEIAQVLGVRPSTVRSLAHRAFSVLRKELS